jgi:uncharacterized membrane protein
VVAAGVPDHVFRGFINGMCVSALAIFHPDAMKTFDDRFYLDESI